MRRILLFTAAAVTLLAAAGSTLAAPGGAGALCVGGGKGCFTTIQAAVDAAKDGDTIKIGRGTFAGGVTILKSITVTGAGASSTIIKGGGPVLRLGEFGMPDPPTIAITGVTVTGGLNTSYPLDSVAFGGGIFIPRSDSGAGATVTISDSVITGNRVEPSTTGFYGSLAFGGGIANDGKLTLVRTVVSDNHAGGSTAEIAIGGGISNANGCCDGELTLIDSVVSGNEAAVAPPNGYIAEGGGIGTQSGETLRLMHSRIERNSVRLESSLGRDSYLNATGGGLNVDGGDGSTTIEDTRISRNTVTVVAPNGEPNAFNPGLLVEGGALTIRNSTISDNVLTATAAGVLSGGVGMEIDTPGTISDTRITGNHATVTGTNWALAVGALWVYNLAQDALVVRDSVVSDNTVEVSSGGTASLEGAGVTNGGTLELHDTKVSGNTGTVTAPAGSAAGGGVWNGDVFGDGPSRLTLDDTDVSRNALTASTGLPVQGGGLFTAFPVTLHDSRIAKNTPDQCFGC